MDDMKEIPAVINESIKRAKLGYTTSAVGLKFKASKQVSGIIVMNTITVYKMWQLYDADRIKEAHAKQL